jgi:hypothetical protein
MKARKVNKNLTRVLDEIAKTHGEVTPAGYHRPASDRKLAPILRTSGTGIGAWRSGESQPSIRSEFAIAEARGWTRTQLVAVIEDEDPVNLICWGIYLLRLKDLSLGTDDEHRNIRLQQAMSLLSSSDPILKRKLTIKKTRAGDETEMIKLSEQQANKISRLILFLESTKIFGDFFDQLDIDDVEKEELYMVIHSCQVMRPLPNHVLDALAKNLLVISNWNPIKVSEDVYYSNWEDLKKSLDKSEVRKSISR